MRNTHAQRADPCRLQALQHAPCRPQTGTLAVHLGLRSCVRLWPVDNLSRSRATTSMRIQRGRQVKHASAPCYRPQGQTQLASAANMPARLTSVIINCGGIAPDTAAGLAPADPAPASVGVAGLAATTIDGDEHANMGVSTCAEVCAASCRCRPICHAKCKASHNNWMAVQ